MVNKSTNINKTNNHLSPQTIKHKKIKTGSGQVQICGGLNCFFHKQNWSPQYITDWNNVESSEKQKCFVIYRYRGEVYTIQHYVIKFVSDLQQVDGFLRFYKNPTQHVGLVQSGSHHHLIANYLVLAMI
jgi:hypothetical protein